MPSQMFTNFDPNDWKIIMFEAHKRFILFSAHLNELAKFDST